MALKDLSVRIGADTTGFDRGLKRVRYGLSSLVKSGLAVAGAAFGLKALEDAYLGLESSVLRVNSLFGDSSKYIRYFAENTAKGFGMAESSAYQYAAIYGNLFKNITSGTAENSKVTIAMLKASAVVASKTGRTMEDVMDRIRSGLLGNTEAIEDLGINVNVAMLESTDAFKRMADGRSWEKLTFYEQQQVRTLAILEQANKNFGTEVQQGSAFSLAVLSGAFKDLMSTMGQFLNAGLQPIIKGLTQLVQWATAGLKALASLMGLKMTMGDTSGANAAADAQKDLTDEIEDTNKALKRTTAGFDVFNDITKATAATEDAVGQPTGNSPFAGIAAPEFEEADISWMDALAKKVERFKGLFDFSGIKQSWANLKEALTPLSENIWSGLTWLWENVLVPFGQWTINEAVPSFFVALSGVLAVVNPWLEAVKPLFNWLWTDFLQPIAAWTGGVIVSVLAGLYEALTAVGEWMSEHISTVEGITAAVAAFFLAWKLTEILGFIQMSGGLIAALKAIGTAIWAVTGAKIVDKAETMYIIGLYAKDFIVTLANSTVQLTKNAAAWIALTAVKVANTAAQLAMTAATAAWNVVCGIATTVTAAFGAAVAFLTSPIGIVTAAIGALIAIGVLLYKNWDTVKTKAVELWEGIKETFAPIGKFFSDLWEGVTGTFKGAINGIIDLVNLLIRGLNKLQIKIPAWSPIFPGKSFGINIPEIPRLASGAIAFGEVQAIVGDNFNARQDPEVIAPLSTLKGMILEALLQKEIAAGGNKEIRVILTLENGEVLADMLIDPVNQVAKKRGYAPVFKPAT